MERPPEGSGAGGGYSAREQLQIQLAHLGHLQAVIGRMSQLGAMSKGWAAALLTGILLLSAKNGSPSVLVVSLLVIGVFWRLDAYFLRLERGFRRAYDAVAAHVASGPHAATNVSPFLEIAPIYKRAESISMLMICRPTLYGFYGSLLMVVLLGMFLIWLSD